MLKESIAIAEAGEKIYDYDDMIYMPVLKDIVNPCETMIIVDECQVQREKASVWRESVWSECVEREALFAVSVSLGQGHLRVSVPGGWRGTNVTTLSLSRRGRTWIWDARQW